jgi:hypothetical protein
LKSESVIDKVLFHKGRVWTIYAETNNGVFCYQGIKPFPNFQYSERTHHDLNSVYFDLEEVESSIIKGEDIDHCMKSMNAADQKKLTQKHAIDFFVHLTGHSRNFVSKHIRNSHYDSYIFSPGQLRYEIWKSEGAILLSHNTNGYTNHAFFDFITFDSHSLLNEKSIESHKKEIIEQYTE